MSSVFPGWPRPIAGPVRAGARPQGARQRAVRTKVVCRSVHPSPRWAASRTRSRPTSTSSWRRRWTRPWTSRSKRGSLFHRLRVPAIATAARRQPWAEDDYYPVECSDAGFFLNAASSSTRTTCTSTSRSTPPHSAALLLRDAGPAGRTSPARSPTSTPRGRNLGQNASKVACGRGGCVRPPGQPVHEQRGAGGGTGGRLIAAPTSLHAGQPGAIEFERARAFEVKAGRAVGHRGPARPRSTTWSSTPRPRGACVHHADGAERGEPRGRHAPSGRNARGRRRQKTSCAWNREARPRLRPLPVVGVH